TLSSLVTSKAKALTVAPLPARSAAAAPRAASSRPLRMIEAPASAKALAMARPSPRLEPVISARLPDRSKGLKGKEALRVDATLCSRACPDKSFYHTRRHIRPEFPQIWLPYRAGLWSVPRLSHALQPRQDGKFSEGR